MKKLSLSLILTIISAVWALADGYYDHRGHNVDSLEIVVSRWDASNIDQASYTERAQLMWDWIELMKGYKQTNSVKNRYYAQKVLDMAQRMGWEKSIVDGAKDIGESYWGNEQYDSAAVYFGIAREALERMKIVPDGEEDLGKSYTQLDKDDQLSSLYGALGNLHSMQNQIDTAMSYYSKALDIFKAYGWWNSCAVCYYNMGETILNTGNDKVAKDYYQESLNYAKQANDSLWIASAYKGFGNLYLAQGKTRKALSCLEEADKYFSLHEDEELFARMETLDFTSKVLRMQKKTMAWALIALAFSLMLFVGLVAVFHRLKVTHKEKVETEEVLSETLEEISSIDKNSEQKLDFKLNDRELNILKMLSQGMTTPQMAETLCLSPETIKWYRKKLLMKFDATSSAELVKKAVEQSII